MILGAQNIQSWNHKISKSITDLKVIMMQVNTHPARLTWKNLECPFGVWGFQCQQTGCRWVGQATSLLVLLLHPMIWMISSWCLFVVLFLLVDGSFSQWSRWCHPIRSLHRECMALFIWLVRVDECWPFPGFRNLFFCLESISQVQALGDSYKGFVKKKGIPLSDILFQLRGKCGVSTLSTLEGGKISPDAYMLHHWGF